MASSVLKLSKAEWREVSHIAANINWPRYAAGRCAELESSLNGRTAAALQQLLRAM